MITETDIPTVFHVELAEVAEAGATDEVGEGVAVGFQEVVSGDVGFTEDKNVEARDGVGKTTAGSADEDEVWVCEGDDVKADETFDEVEGSVVVWLGFGGNRKSPRLGKRAFVVVVGSRGTGEVGITMLVGVGRRTGILVVPVSVGKSSPRNP